MQNLKSAAGIQAAKLSILTATDLNEVKDYPRWVFAAALGEVSFLATLSPNSEYYGEPAKVIEMRLRERIRGLFG